MRHFLRLVYVFGLTRLITTCQQNDDVKAAKCEINTIASPVMYSHF